MLTVLHDEAELAPDLHAQSLELSLMAQYNANAQHEPRFVLPSVFDKVATRSSQ